jgi:hypothetical protein
MVIDRPRKCHRFVAESSHCPDARPRGSYSAFFGVRASHSGKVGWVTLSLLGGGELSGKLELGGFSTQKDLSSVFVMKSCEASRAVVGRGNGIIEDADMKRVLQFWNKTAFPTFWIAIYLCCVRVEFDVEIFVVRDTLGPNT